MGREDGDKLLNALLPFAQQVLAKYGAFHPFGAYMNASGEIVLLGAYDGQEYPKGKALVEMMVGALRKDAPGYSAVGICYDVLVIPPNQTKKTDAVEVDVEYADGEGVAVYLPYKKGWFRKIQYGQIFASPADSKIFKNSPKNG
ncbi:MAG TPA: hypothetical protein VI431_16435 [Candidatus Acidoferrum sp.]